jgi:hypothetical protein
MVIIMRLNTEFYASTKLRDWYPVVKENFEIIQAKTNELEGKVNNAMTKRDVNVYFNQVLESTGTNINAVEELAQAIENADQSIAEALRDLSGGRLRAVTVAAADCAGTSIDAELGEENEIVFFGASVDGSPTEGAVTVLRTPAADYLFSSDTIYVRTSNGTWKDIHSEIRSELNIVKSELRERPRCLFGVYVGDGAESRVINLGFTPDAVEIYFEDGTQVFDTYATAQHYGGLAIKQYPCRCSFMNNQVIFEVCEGGFKVYSWTDSLSGNPDHDSRVNENGKKYYFKAYKSDKDILVIETEG